MSAILTIIFTSELDLELRTSEVRMVQLEIMRRDFFALDTYHHILNRGSRDMDIVLDDSDKWNFNLLLFYQNDKYYSENWKRDINGLAPFERPKYWPKRDPLVKIIGYCLHNNHFHLLVKEIREKGISEFMRRMPNSMTKYYNKKYKSTGSIFKGPYQSRLIESDADLDNVAMYISVKNVFEKFPGGGISGAVKDFEKAWKWAITDPFSSFAEYAEVRNYPIIDQEIIRDKYTDHKVFKKWAKDFLLYWRDRKNFKNEAELQ